VSPLARSINPLFLRTLAEELRVFGVHEKLRQRLDYYLESRTIDALFGRVLERVEGDCGAIAVRTTMEAIWASRAGLTEEEILGLGKVERRTEERTVFDNLVPATGAPIRNAIDDALLESSGRMTFAHDYLRRGVKDRYLADDAAERQVHTPAGDLVRGPAG
jgi:hypothetical protein